VSRYLPAVPAALLALVVLGGPAATGTAPAFAASAHGKPAVAKEHGSGGSGEKSDESPGKGSDSAKSDGNTADDNSGAKKAKDKASDQSAQDKATPSPSASPSASPTPTRRAVVIAPRPTTRSYTPAPRTNSLVRATAAPVTDDASVDAALPAPNPMLLPGSVSAQTAPVDAESSSPITSTPVLFLGVGALAVAFGTAAVAKRRRRAVDAQR
jgi:hypothetical protein